MKLKLLGPSLRRIVAAQRVCLGLRVPFVAAIFFCFFEDEENRNSINLSVDENKSFGEQFVNFRRSIEKKI